MRLLASLVALALAAPAFAQSAADPDQKVAQGDAPTPAGWQVRLDRPNAKASDIRFVSMGKGMHVTAGPAAIYWTQPAATGNYTLAASFTQTKPSRHPEGYGLVLGGTNLDGENQSYVYFLVRQDGKFMINHRAGAEVHKLVPWTDHAAIQQVAEGGKATNKLEVRVAPDAVQFLVNGQQVQSLPRDGMLKNVNGQAGIRVNHNLDVHVDGFAATPAK